MERKNNLIDLLNRTYALEITFVDDLDVAARSEEGSMEFWSAKDTLIHCFYWTGELADNLALVSKGEPPLREESINHTNEANYERHHLDTWEMAMSGVKDAFELLSEQTQRLTEADLERLDVFPWQNGRPVWRLIAGNGTLHPLSHLAKYTSQHTGIKKILAAYEDHLPLLSGLDDSIGWQALLQYDLACFCALAGQNKHAIQSLGKSLRLSPDFMSYAQQDEDLDSLRQDIEFQELFI